MKQQEGPNTEDEIMHPLASIVGKTITGVIYKVAPKGESPGSQLFLVFPDGTHYEVYTGSGEIAFTKGLWPGDIEHVRNYMPEMKIVFDSSKWVSSLGSATDRS